FRVLTLRFYTKLDKNFVLSALDSEEINVILMNKQRYKRHLSTTSNSQTPNSTMAKTKELSKETRNKIVDLHQAGKTESAIAERRRRETSTAEQQSRVTSTVEQQGQATSTAEQQRRATSTAEHSRRATSTDERWLRGADFRLAGVWNSSRGRRAGASWDIDMIFLQNDSNKLEQLGKHIQAGRRYEHITPILATLHWLPVKFRIDYKILLLTYKALNGLTPQYLSDLLVIYDPPRLLRSKVQVI
ncbi:hypothetical protein QTP70_033443, partial [Hemibagrus guttatus]